MKKAKKKLKKPRAFESYDIGDWIIPIAQDTRMPHLYRARAFSGNFVFGEHFGTEEMKSLKKTEHTKAHDADVAQVIAWRLKGGQWK